MRLLATLAVLALIVVPSGAGALPIVGVGARYAAGTFAMNTEPDAGCADLVGPGALSYVPADDFWEMRLYAVVAVEPAPECYIPVIAAEWLFGFPTDIAQSGAVVERWISGACGSIFYVVDPFPTPGDMRVTADFLPPAGCTQQWETHLEWDLVVT